MFLKAICRGLSIVLSGFVTSRVDLGAEAAAPNPLEPASLKLGLMVIPVARRSALANACRPREVHAEMPLAAGRVRH